MQSIEGRLEESDRVGVHIRHCALFLLHLIRGCGSTAEYGRAKAETTVQLRPPAPIWWEMEYWSHGVLVYCLQTFVSRRPFQCGVPNSEMRRHGRHRRRGWCLHR